jgi:hypothetical protein
MEAITDLQIPQSFTDVVRGEPTTLEEAISAYLNDPARLQEWLDSSATRIANFNYELRHPGHGDQSVHNPHKGAAVPYAAGAWRPVSAEQITAVDKAVLADMDKPVNGYLFSAEQKAAIKKDYENDTIVGETYSNGNVTVRFPDDMTVDQKQGVLRDIDTAMSHAPAAMVADPKFPITVMVHDSLGPGKGGDHVGEYGFGATIRISKQQIQDPIGSLDLTNLKTYQLAKNRKSDVYGTKVSWHAEAPFGTRSSTYTIAHEFGHAVGAYNQSTKISAFGDTSIFTVGKSNFGADLAGGGGTAWFNRAKQAGFISKYATKNSSERYAEHFAAWTLGARDAFTSEIAKLEDWN